MHEFTGSIFIRQAQGMADFMHQYGEQVITSVGNTVRIGNSGVGFARPGEFFIQVRGRVEKPSVSGGIRVDADGGAKRTGEGSTVKVGNGEKEAEDEPPLSIARD